MFHLDYQENGYSTGSLTFNEAAWLPHLNVRPTIVSITPTFSKDRAEVKDFIIHTYAQAYHAQIGVHYPILMSVRNDEGRILAALGFRCAAEAPLFLEQYLPEPIEEILDAPRSQITEIGNLASAGGGASIFLFAALSAYLNSKGQTHAVVTGTKFIEKRLRSLGLRPVRIAPADPALLLQKNESWGTYYETKPYVLAGKIDEGYCSLQKALGATYTKNNLHMHPSLHIQESL